MSNNNFGSTISTIFGFVFGLGGLGIAAWFAKKNDDLADKIDKSLSDIEKATPIEIRDDIIDRAIQNAANKKVGKAMESAVNSVKDNYDRQIRSGVGNEIEKQFESIGQNVSDEVVRQIASMNKNAMAERIIPKVEKMMEDQMRDKLNNKLGDISREYTKKMDEMARDFKEQFERVKGIFQWVTDATTPRSNPPSGWNYYGR